ncbi:hypothetical protein HPP92_013198 [Vanilla planifolia]|uniref:SAC3/GANP/THP3 conserved domain-containing protein n=2 Tax=Vanilla planifolia TaxID=51239 RepID=A0A835UWI6_VANPL|nr:hypothetical protein HPP92_013198 [Vanilla planifolia]
MTCFGGVKLQTTCASKKDLRWRRRRVQCFLSMSFADFSKSSGPSGPPRNQTMFGNAPAFTWKPPISYPKGPIVPNQNVVEQQEQQLFPSPERSGGLAEICSRDKVNESPKLTDSMALNSESNSTVQNPNFSSKVSVRLEVSHNKPEQQRISPPHIFTSSQRLDRLTSHSDAQTARSFSPPKLAYGGAPKRARSPVVSMEEPFHSSSVPLESDSIIHSGKSMLKQKRLARFNIERAHPIQNLNDISRHKLSGSRQDEFHVNPSKTDERMEEAQVVFGGGFSDLDGAKSMKVVGLCPDMCPESEREERERKGDLDKYERLDGDRNQTSKYLAVKKYNRTAEREAELIRPLPVLQRTVAYLLNLLDQPYDGSFLNIYNFLWDRMRAIRMDLRMQHIFNADAIAMLEQMIRIHIIAMHELCEFEKGEGFTEGFDAHLNIEQMNKTSVELFQMYDDHRKKAKIFLSEKEFRGYYALLKLDKHPGYKVEPAELSLDLAKMTSETRCTHEILFARDVARACRIGNYIAFFRLARKATYLQACLMHAHFSKMRKQALTSLHSGLQHNQGIPVGHVEKWLALEGEDVVGLLEFYGFSIKRYEEAYLVKEGPLLNSDMEFPTRCARLVQSKRSSKIVDDVRTAVTFEELPAESECRQDVVDIVDQRKPIDTEMQLNVFDELLDSQIIHAPINLKEPKLFEERPAVILNKENRVKMPQMLAMKAPIASPVENVGGYADQDEDQEMVFGDRETLFNGVTFQIDENDKVHHPVHQSSICMSFDLATKVPESEHLKKEVLLSSFNEEEETDMEKLRQILRKWKKHSAQRRESREQKEFLANSALSSLSLGPPVCQIQSQQTLSNGALDIDSATIARFWKYENCGQG